MQTGVTGTQGCGHCTKHRYHGDILPSVAFVSVHRRSLGKTCGPRWNPVAWPSGKSKPGRISILFKAGRSPWLFEGDDQATGIDFFYWEVPLTALLS